MTDHTENPRNEIVAEVFHGIPQKSIFESMSDCELAELHASLLSDKVGPIIIQNEWRRRERIVQHELNQEIIRIQHEMNLKIFKKQSSLVKISIVTGFVGVILGAILASWLPTILSVDKQELPTTRAIQPSRTTTSNHQAQDIHPQKDTVKVLSIEKE